MYDADVIVVGARCSGASLAMLLARAGLHVILLDRSRLPSDKPDSTHLVHPPAIELLHKWGLLSDLESRSKAPRIFRYGLKDESIDFMASLPSWEGIDFALAPRRYSLDAALLDGAVDSGVDFRNNSYVFDLLYSDDRVKGVRVRTREGTDNSYSLHSRLVVGADGVNSKVAKLVFSEKYWEKPLKLKSVWNYWPDLGIRDVPTWRDRNGYAFAWPTNNGETLVGHAWPASRFPCASNRIADYFAALQKFSPDFYSKISVYDPTSRWMSGSVPNFFRVSSGLGWALIGDAGYSRDPVTAAGITDALRSADYLSEAIISWMAGEICLEEALFSYEIRRNIFSRPFYEYTCDFADLQPFSKDISFFLKHALLDTSYASSMAGLFAQTSNPSEVFSVESILDVLRSSRFKSNFRLRLLMGIAGKNPTGIRRKISNLLIYSQLGDFGNYLSSVSRSSFDRRF